MTLWSPDTCRCQIEIADSGPNQGQTVRHVVRCPLHLAADHTVVVAENQNKNKACNAADNALGNPPHGTGYAWSMGPGQITVITLPVGASAVQRSAVTSAVAAVSPTAVVK